MIRDAYILDPTGNKIIDFKKSNLHVVHYSVPVDTDITLSELQEHLYSRPNQPDAIPYITSFYEERWGFCLAHREREKLAEGTYHVHIDSDLKNGSLTYGELVVPGEHKEEIFISTYVCHPSLANNELSGPVVATFLARWIMSQPRRYTYRIIFIPETIGSIMYLCHNVEAMKKHVIAGFNMTCVGDERAYSYLPSRLGGTLPDRVVHLVLSHRHPEFITYSFLDRGSDERQYCAPGIDLPVVSVMRTKYGRYPEYHSSLDNLSLITPNGLEGTYGVMKDCLELIERNHRYSTTVLGEPQMGRRGLYPTLGNQYDLHTHRMMDVLAYADGKHDLVDLCTVLGITPWDLYPIIETLRDAGLIELC